MQKVIELTDGKVLSEIDIQFMELNEINNVLELIQTEMYQLTSEKRKLCTLPACKKDIRTLKRVGKIKDRLSELQLAQSWIGRIRKQKRDSMQKERDWYKNFYKLVRDNIKKSQFEKFVEQTNIKQQYTVNF